VRTLGRYRCERLRNVSLLYLEASSEILILEVRRRAVRVATTLLPVRLLILAVWIAFLLPDVLAIGVLATPQAIFLRVRIIDPGRGLGHIHRVAQLIALIGHPRQRRATLGWVHQMRWLLGPFRGDKRAIAIVASHSSVPIFAPGCLGQLVAATILGAPTSELNALELVGLRDECTPTDFLTLHRLLHEANSNFGGLGLRWFSSCSEGSAHLHWTILAALPRPVSP